jgi:DNA-3-methyladenine glycosylase
MPPRLDRRFYRRGPVPLARALLGQRLVRILNRPHGQRLAGLIVEVEAYLGEQDKAAHTYNARRTPRNESMWQDGGHAYVYFTYGMHHCMNVVASEAGRPVAVLIRALEPTEGIDLMYQRRTAARRDTDLCSGPAKLCQALDIDRKLDGHDLTKGPSLFIEQIRKTAIPAARITVGPRVGVSYAEEWTDKPLRFYLTDNPHVSRPR